MSSEDPWEMDLLGRKPEAELLQKYLCSVGHRNNHPHGHKSFVLNLKSEWGTGKTFFLDAFAQQLHNEKHIVASVDTWRADQQLDPLISIVSGCRDALTPHISKTSKIGRTLKSATGNAGKVLALTSAGIARRTITKALGVELENLVDELNLGVDDEVVEGVSESVASAIDESAPQFAIANYFDRQLAAVRARTLAVQAFNKDMAAVLQSLASSGKIQLPMFVFVDELDRCRPTFAISVLERINHLFDIEGMVFVIGTDTDQLSHAVNAVYGPGFSSKEYLDRFFSQTYKLRSLDLSKAIRKTISEYSIDLNKFATINFKEPFDGMVEVVSQTSPNIRHAKKVLNLIAAFSALWDRPEKLDEIYLAACAFATVNQDDAWLRSAALDTAGTRLTAAPLSRSQVHVPRYSNDKDKSNLSDYCKTFRDAGDRPYQYILRKDPNKNAALTRVHDLVAKEQELNSPNNAANEMRPSWGGYPEGILTLNNFVE